MYLFEIHPESDPVCSTNTTSEVLLHDAVQMHCGTVVYGNLPLWTNWTLGGTTIDTFYNPPILSGSVNVSISAPAAHSPIVPQYTCTMSFDAPPASDGMANNTPTYNGSCSTDQLDVLCKFENSLYHLDCTKLIITNGVCCEWQH